MLKAKKCLLSLLMTFLTLSPMLATANQWTNRIEEGGLNAIGSQAYGENGAPQKSIYSIVASVIKVALSLLGIIFVVLLILAGVKYMTSGGDQDKIKEAVAQIRNAVIGLIIVVAALAITTFITTRVVNNIVR